MLSASGHANSLDICNSPYLEKHLRSHTEEAVDYPEGKDHGHAVDESAAQLSVSELCADI